MIKYLDGTIKTRQSFLDKNTSIDEILDIIGGILEKERSRIIRGGGNAKFRVVLKEEVYKIVIRNGQIRQFFRQ